MTTQHHEIFIRTTPERLWAALTRPEQTPAYMFGTTLQSSLRVGEPFRYVMPDGSLASDGEVLAIEPGRSLTYAWVIEYDPSLSGERSRVKWTIEARGEACKLTIDHDFAEAPRTAAHVGLESWPMILSALKTVVETGAPLVVAPAA